MVESLMTDSTITPDLLDQLAGESGFTHHGRIETDGLRVSKEIRALCASNTCGNYGKNWMCPPGVGELPELEATVRGYRYCHVLQYVGTIEDSFDFEGMQEIARDFDRRVRELRARLRTQTDEEFLVLGAGPCTHCADCTYLQGEPCRDPEEALSSAEAYGFNVKKIVESAGLSYINGTNTVSYVGVVLYGEAG